MVRAVTLFERARRRTVREVRSDGRRLQSLASALRNHAGRGQSIQATVTIWLQEMPAR